MPSYTLLRSVRAPRLTMDWDGPEWKAADTLEISHFLPESSSHRPKTQAKLLYSSEGIHGIFKVQDRYVRCRGSRYGSPAFQDSCVEFFVEPVRSRGYFNFEFGCGGALLCSHITDHRRTGNGFRSWTRIPEEAGTLVRIAHSLPEAVDPEDAAERVWLLEFIIPFTLMERYVGSLSPVVSCSWRGNFYKCADKTSHPHWASWAPLPEKNFHLPECFGDLHFE